MFCFVQQNGGPLCIVNSFIKELAIQSYNFKRKIGCSVSITVAQILIPPAVGRTIARESLEDERMFAKAFGLYHCYSAISDFMLIVTEIVRRNQHRHVRNE